MREKREKKRREKERKKCPGSIIINMHAICKKEKLTILAEMLEI